ncbi:MAG: glycosyltransferase [Gemmatimonadales bacterium]
MTRPRVLLLSRMLPYPLDSGSAIRGFHLLRALASACDVTALCFARRKGGALRDDDLPQRVAALRELANVETFPVPQQHGVWRLAWDHVRSLSLSRVYTRFVYDSPALSARIRELLRARQFDLIHVDTIALSRFLPLLAGPPVVCAHENVESVLLQRRAAFERTPWRRIYLRHQSRLMTDEERRWCGRCDLNVVVSEADRMLLQRIAPEARIAVIPNGVDLERFRPAESREDGVVFVGESTWFPNRDALQYFCDEILPSIRAAGFGPPVQWVGHAEAGLRRTVLDRYGVELTGYVPDVRPYVRDAACYVVPLRTGGGTRLKILDAWAMGKAVVSTSIGCEGLAAENGRNILVRDDPAGFAHAVCDVLRDATLRRRLGVEGRRTVEQRYGWDRIGESLLTLYRSLPLEGRRPRASLAPA